MSISKYLVALSEKVTESVTEKLPEATDNAFLKIAKDLGLERDAFIFYFLCFSITLGFLTYFLFRPLLKLINSRQQQIKDNVIMEADLNTKLSSIESSKAELKTQMYKEKSVILLDAKAEAKILADSIINEANIKSVNIVNQAEKDSLLIKENSKSSVEKEVLAYYSEIITNNLKSLRSTPEHNELIMKELLSNPIK